MDNVIVVASGKGGTGKSTVCICLSVALIKQGKKVLLIDCDCGMRGLDIMLDMENDIVFDAADAVSGNCSFTDAVYKSKNNENLYLIGTNATVICNYGILVVCLCQISTKFCVSFLVIFSFKSSLTIVDQLGRVSILRKEIRSCTT